MAKVINTIKAALAYAHDKEVKDTLEVLLDATERDLEDVGFESSASTDDAVKDVERAMNEFDERIATRRVDLKEAIAESKEAEEENGD